MRAASRPMGPAPVITTRVGAQWARPADAVDLLPGLGHHAGGLEEHAEPAQSGVDLDHEVGLDPVALRAVAVALLDPALGVLAVVAEIPLAHGAVGAGHRVGPADDPDHQVAGRHRGPGRGLEHPAERLVAEHEPVASRAAASRRRPR